MRRRAALRLGAIAGAWLALSAHTPYRQWQVYRMRYLLIGTSRRDALGHELGQRVAAALLEALPESKARVARGPDAQRLASLLTTGQLQLALLARADVEALRDGVAPFQAFGPTELRALFRFGDHWLVAPPDFPDAHAWQVTGALAPQLAAFEQAEVAGPLASPVPPHRGTAAFLAGAPMPEAVELVSDPGLLPHDHPH
jgi:hypothetical protein